MKLPAFQFYPADWKKDPGVQALSFHDRGVWFEILCLMHESEQRGKLLLGSQPMPESALARLLGLDNQNLTTTLTTLLTYGVASRDAETNALICRRMVRDEELRNVRKKCGKLGGNPNLVNQTSNQNPTTQVKQKSTPSSSSSSSISFIKPSADDVNEFGRTLNPPFTRGQAFVDFYQSKGWKVGKTPMKDWEACVRNWHRSDAPKNTEDELFKQRSRQ